jgi:hypothetical protein
MPRGRPLYSHKTVLASLAGDPSVSKYLAINTYLGKISLRYVLYTVMYYFHCIDKTQTVLHTAMQKVTAIRELVSLYIIPPSPPPPPSQSHPYTPHPPPPPKSIKSFIIGTRANASADTPFRWIFRRR